ncbi:MAG: DNA mismatch repair protein MutS [Lachnospiraceae bacterium]|nr:DNA mismatch repair protein MutS [Lachnospiraceae bacterium]
MMKLYMDTKKEYSDCILFYRLGDFYEMFFDDALEVSRELELTLTGKQCGLAERAPMCGIPFHALETYLDRLVASGHKVAICEQVEDPKLAKGLVKREVIRVVTPGTNLSERNLSEKVNRYLMSVLYEADITGLSVIDISTGDFYLTEVDSLKTVMDEINKYMPAEIICNDAFLISGIDIETIRDRLGIAISALEPHYYDEDTCRNVITGHFKVNGINGLGIADFPAGTVAAGALLKYLYDTQKNELGNITHIYPYLTSTYMLLDSATRRNLELTETLREKQKRGSLMWVLDKTKTAMGSRMLMSMLRQPLIEKTAITERLDAVEDLTLNPIDRDEIREYLNTIYDLERLMGKVCFRTANARDLIALKSSLSMLPDIKKQTAGFKSELIRRLSDEIDGLEEIYQLIDKGITDEPPLTVREGGIIRDGYSEDVDKLRSIRTDGKKYLAAFESEEQERTGIKTLHVKYNKVFGYYIEISNSYKDMAPEDYVRKQTTTNGERFTNTRLKELEDTILNAEDKLVTLEYDLFTEIRDYVLNETERIQRTAKAVAALDVYASLSLVASQNNYCKPVINEKGVINIKNGRHPVIEKIISNDMFVSNDTYLDNKKHLISIITGPNMAGKSTYMRQVALIVLMAQIGSFVPADSADICLVDRIFTRVGASDDLASGQSTFMVEMNEVANILRNATSKSLIILDEIGRGTSTFDGLSIAWAVVEHIANTRLLGAKTLFATHYHELTELEGNMDNVVNYCIAVKEKGDSIVFLRKIIKGGADRSYGIQVAKLAGIPDIVTDRAKEIAADLADNDIVQKVQQIAGSIAPNDKKVKHEHLDAVDLNQMSLFDTVKDEDVINELKELDISNLTPLDALNTLYKLQNNLKNRWTLV